MKLIFGFLLHEVLSREPIQVTGRNCEADLPLGTVFTGIYRRDFPPRAPGEDIGPVEAVFIAPVCLRLDAAEMYRRSVDFVGSGHTALLTLSGSGVGAIADLVAAAPPRTYFSLGLPATADTI